jgi:fumarylacetoacetate (FAA) hydrolase
MKLASLNSTSNRDGTLCVVNKELTQAVTVEHIAETLQKALEQWTKVAGPLEEISQALNSGKVEHAFPYHESDFLSPLPRAYQWADGSAYVNHVELVRKARGAVMPDNFWTTPLMYQGGSDRFLSPTEAIPVSDEAFGIDFEAEVAIITDDVPMGISKEKAGQHIKLIMLVNDVSLRNLIPEEVGKGFGFFQSKPASSFSPIALTPDELGDYWHDERVHLPIMSYLNGELFGQPNAGVDMVFSFADLIAHAAKTRHLAAGTIIGSGTVSNLDRSKGSSCLVEKRMLEILADGKPSTHYMRFGDTIRIEMRNPEGHSLFGAIEQTVTHYQG